MSEALRAHVTLATCLSDSHAPWVLGRPDCSASMTFTLRRSASFISQSCLCWPNAAARQNTPIEPRLPAKLRGRDNHVELWSKCRGGIIDPTTRVFLVASLLVSRNCSRGSATPARGRPVCALWLFYESYESGGRLEVWHVVFIQREVNQIFGKNQPRKLYLQSPGN